MEDSEQMGYIHMDRFLPVMSRYSQSEPPVCQALTSLLSPSGSFCSRSSSLQPTRTCWRRSGLWTQRTPATSPGTSSRSCSLRRARPSVRRRWRSSAMLRWTQSQSPSTTESSFTSWGLTTISDVWCFCCHWKYNPEIQTRYHWLSLQVQRKRQKTTSDKRRY